MIRLPAIAKDGKHFVVVFVPVFAFADKPTQSGKSRLSVFNGDLFTPCVAE